MGGMTFHLLSIMVSSALVVMSRARPPGKPYIYTHHVSTSGYVPRLAENDIGLNRQFSTWHPGGHQLGGGGGRGRGNPYSGYSPSGRLSRGTNSGRSPIQPINPPRGFTYNRKLSSSSEEAEDDIGMNRQFNTWHPGGHQLGGGGGGGGRGNPYSGYSPSGRLSRGTNSGRSPIQPINPPSGFTYNRKLASSEETEDEIGSNHQFNNRMLDSGEVDDDIVGGGGGSDYSGNLDSQEADVDIAGLNRQRRRGRGRRTRTRRPSGSSSGGSTSGVSGGSDLERIHHGQPSSSWPYGLPKGGIPDPVPPGGYQQAPNWVTGSR